MPSPHLQNERAQLCIQRGEVDIADARSTDAFATAGSPARSRFAERRDRNGASHRKAARDQLAAHRDAIVDRTVREAGLALGEGPTGLVLRYWRCRCEVPLVGAQLFRCIRQMREAAARSKAIANRRRFGRAGINR